VRQVAEQNEALLTEKVRDGRNGSARTGVGDAKCTVSEPFVQCQYMPSIKSSADLNEHCRRSNASIDLQFIVLSKPVILYRRRRRCMPDGHSLCYGLKTSFLCGHDSVWENVTTKGGAHVGQLFDRKYECNKGELPYTLQENTNNWFRNWQRSFIPDGGVHDWCRSGRSHVADG